MKVVVTTANLKKEQASVSIQSRNIILDINTNTELVKVKLCTVV
jgi:hypothetical protein